MSDHHHYDYAEARHDHRGDYAADRHDHDNEYAERYHRHYDDERTAEGLREDLGLDDAEVIGTVTDAMGDFVKVGVLGSAALIGVSGSPGILDTPQMREEFTGYWAEACRRADAAGTATPS